MSPVFVVGVAGNRLPQTCATLEAPTGNGDHMPEDSIDVSVVIPAYNRADYIAECVQSVCSQVPKPREVLVVDDGSTDDTAAVVEALGLGVTVIRQPNGGEGAARNSGVAAASSEWVAFLDSDDWWLPGHLATLWGHREGLSFLSTVAVGTLSSAIRGSTASKPVSIRSGDDVLWPENPLVPSASMARREDLLAVGGFGTQKRSADLDLWVRLTARGQGLALPDVTCMYREHAEQVSQDTGLMRQSVEELLQGYGTDVVTASTRAKVRSRNSWDDLRASPHGAPQQLVAVGKLLARRPASALAIWQVVRCRQAGKARRREYLNR